MNETMKYVLKKSAAYLWIAVLAALALTAVYVVPKLGAAETAAAPDAEASVESPAPAVQWEVQPDASRYAIYALEAKKELFTNEYFISDPMKYLGQYNEMLRQALLSADNIFSVYQGLADQYEGLSSVYTCENMLDEMIEIVSLNQSTILICVRSPFSVNRNQTGFSLSEEELCRARDFVCAQFTEQIDSSDAYDGFPLKLARAAKTTEDLFSEQSYLNGRFTFENDSDSRAESGEYASSGISKRKAAAVFLLGFCLSYAVIALAILGNGKIKTPEELSELTNLEIYDDFLHADYKTAVKTLSAKIETKSLPEKVPLVSLQVPENEALKIAEDLSAAGSHPFVFTEWNRDKNTAPVTSLCGSSYFLLVGVNKTKKTELKKAAKEFSQMNAVCLGAIICK